MRTPPSKIIYRECELPSELPFMFDEEDLKEESIRKK